jgi:hypothetical protein
MSFFPKFAGWKDDSNAFTSLSIKVLKIILPQRHSTLSDGKGIPH